MNATDLPSAPTLCALIDARRRLDQQVTYIESEQQAQAVPFALLYERALGILFHLQRLGLRAGDRMILLLGANEPFVDAFWAAVLGGIVPVPVAPGISDEHRHKLLRIARKLGNPWLYTEQRLLDRVGAFATTQANESERATFESLRQRAYLIDQLEDVRRAGQPAAVKPTDTAFIQFSSGSTSEPKGVVLTHANLLANIASLVAGTGFGRSDVALSWMPLTHDMGLIGFHLAVLAAGGHGHLMPTELFVRRPLLWLQWASRLKATTLCSPNFGYRHYLKVLGDRPVEDLDLRSVRLLMNGAEPISAALCEQFLERLAPAGLAPTSMFPVYGLAEASLGVSFPPRGKRFRTCAFDRHSLGLGASVKVVDPADRQAVRLVSVGASLPPGELRLSDAADQPVAAGQVGQIEIRGPNVTAGYLDDAAANAAAFAPGGWLRTGDLGVEHEGELYITGRLKEILFVNGQNYYPHDLEHIAEQAPGMELGKLAVAGVRAPGADTDQLVVFALHRGSLAEFEPIARDIAHRINEHAGLEVSAVVPVRRIPKTTSGKVQRHVLEQEFAEGQYAADLQALEALRSEHAPSGGGSRSDIEEQLQQICAAQLDGRQLDVDQNLFDIGASSLKLIAIHEQIEQRWPGQVDLPDLFEHPSIRELAQVLQAKLSASA